MTDKELCIKCGHTCCKWLAFSTTKMSPESVEFYIARGCKVLKCNIEDEEIFRVYMPHPCPHIIEGEGCDIQDMKPEICKTYIGTDDPIVSEVCLIKEVDNGETPS